MIDGLSELEDHAARELRVKDLVENIIVKIADEVIVDVSRRAGTLSYDDVSGDISILGIEGIEIPFLGIDSLIESKRTYRERDQIDLKILLRIRDECGHS